jgi:hypothetical protein
VAVAQCAVMWRMLSCLAAHACSGHVACRVSHGPLITCCSFCVTWLAGHIGLLVTMLHCPAPPRPALPPPPRPALRCLDLPCSALLRSALPCPALLYFALLCPALPCPALPRPALRCPCPALLRLALLCPALLCPALLCPALPCAALPLSPGHRSVCAACATPPSLSVLPST